MSWLSRIERRILGITPTRMTTARWALEVVTPPASEPVTLDELKQFLRIDLNTEDALISALGVAARELVERVTSRALMTQTLALHLDQEPEQDCLELPRAPLTSVTSITYVPFGSTIPVVFPLTNITINKFKLPARLTLVNGAVWPLTLREEDSFVVTYVAGAATSAEVPQALKEAIKVCVAAWFEQRGQMEQGKGSSFGDLDKTPAMALALMSSYRVRTL